MQVCVLHRFPNLSDWGEKKNRLSPQSARCKPISKCLPRRGLGSDAGRRGRTRKCKPRCLSKRTYTERKCLCRTHILLQRHWSARFWGARRPKITTEPIFLCAFAPRLLSKWAACSKSSNTQEQRRSWMGRLLLSLIFALYLFWHFARGFTTKRRKHIDLKMKNHTKYNLLVPALCCASKQITPGTPNNRK